MVTSFSQGSWGSGKLLSQDLTASSREAGIQVYFLFPLLDKSVFNPPVCVLRGFCGHEVGEGRTKDLSGARGTKVRDYVEEHVDWVA